MSKIYETDPRFTAYLLGELPAEEAKEVERLLGEHPADAAEWEKTRDLIARLTETLDAEAVPEAAAENPLIFKEKPKMDTNKTNEPVVTPKKRTWFRFAMEMTAVLAVVCVLASFLLPAVNMSRESARKIAAMSMMDGEIDYYGDPLGGPVPNTRVLERRENSRYAEAPAADAPVYADMDMAEAADMVDESVDELVIPPDTIMDSTFSLQEVDIPVDDMLEITVEAEEPAPAIVEVDARSIGNLQGSDVGKSIANYSGSGSGMGKRKAAGKTGLAGRYNGSPQAEEAPEVVHHDPLHGLGDKKTASDSSASGHVLHHHAGREVEQAEIERARLAARDPHAGMKDETYKAFIENVFEDPAAKPFSTFGIDVDSASYTVMRQYLNDRNAKPPAQSVRVEEYINYFKYALAPPAADAETPFAVKTDLFAHPWQDGLMMMKITLKGKEMAKDTRPPLNLVFLLDVSGSMSSENRLPLVKSSMIELLDELTERDRVAIVTYANGTQVNLTPTVVTDNGRHEIAKVINSLGASGGTSGGAGLKLAYAEAKKNFNGEAVNRIVLCTDGDFNIGETGDPAMEEIVAQGAKTGVFLTVLGFGMGNYKDARLKLLSDKGNGNYGYIDTAEEARRLLVENLTGTMITIAKDVKIQLDFNPKYVAAYRLIGYENRKMAAKDFHDDKKDSGEIGAGHTVTALYELVPKGIRIPNVEPVSRYAEDAVAAEEKEEEVITPGEMLTVALRYKLPESDTSTLVEFKQPSPESLSDLPRMDTESHFASAVALYAMLLRQSEYTGSSTFDTVLELAQPGVGDSAARKEFVELVKKAMAL